MLCKKTVTVADFQHLHGDHNSDGYTPIQHRLIAGYMPSDLRLQHAVWTN